MKKWFDEEYEFTVEVVGFLRGDHTERYCRNGEEIGDQYSCTYGCPVNQDGFGICSKTMMMLYPLMEAVRSGGDLENLGGDGKYTKTIVCPGEEIVLDAHVFRDPDGSAVSSGLKYKWEIVKGIDGGYAALDDNIEGVVGDYPSATLKFTGIPDSASESFGYGVTVKVTVYDGKDSGTELTSGTIDTLLLDEYFEITPHRIDQIQVGEERTIPISIRYCGYYFDSFRYGYDVEWRFTYDENVLQLTDPDGNILDGTGTEPYEPGNSMNEPEITIRRLSGGWTDLEAKATFHYIDHNQNKRRNNDKPSHLLL